MTTKSHKTLTSTQLHENKGADTASDDTVATITSNATVWKKLTASNLTGTGNSFGAQLLHVRDEKTSGSSPGTLTGNTYTQRTLNTTKTNEIASATLVSNQISLPAGTYFIMANVPMRNAKHRSRLFSVTDNAELVSGTSENVSAASQVVSHSKINGRFTIAGTKVMEIQTFTNNTDQGGDTVSDGKNEVYTEVMIWKVA